MLQFFLLQLNPGHLLPKIAIENRSLLITIRIRKQFAGSLSNLARLSSAPSLTLGSIKISTRSAYSLPVGWSVERHSWPNEPGGAGKKLLHSQIAVQLAKGGWRANDEIYSPMLTITFYYPTGLEALQRRFVKESSEGEFERRVEKKKSKEEYREDPNRAPTPRLVLRTSKNWRIKFIKRLEVITLRITFTCPRSGFAIKKTKMFN